MGAHHSQSIGAGFEGYLADLHEVYARQGRAFLEKTHPPVRVIETLDGGRFVGQWIDKGAADYAGTLAGGRAVHLEAKATGASRFRLRRVQAHQRERLARHRAMGAMSFVLLRDLTGGGDYLLPVDEAGQVEGLTSRASATFAQLRPWRISSAQTWLDRAVEVA